MKVYKCINQVQAELAKTGISKGQRNSQQGYSFRGIDDVYNALAPLLATNGLCILPEVVERSVTEKISKNGSALFYVVVVMRFHFVCAEDSSTCVVCTYGEAMDSGDKATNKAMSAAYKYACMQTFCIPVEGDNDADSTTHVVVAPKVETEMSTYQQVCNLITEKTVGSAAVKQWCTQNGVERLSEINEKELTEILMMLQGK